MFNEGLSISTSWWHMELYRAPYKHYELQHHDCYQL